MSTTRLDRLSCLNHYIPKQQSVDTSIATNTYVICGQDCAC